MKKTILTSITIALSGILFAQKSTGVITLGGVMTAKIDLNTTTSTVLLTMTGPSDRWFGLGFDTQIMKQLNGDVVIMTDVKLEDRHLSLSYETPQLDATQNWTLTSNTVANNIRTITASRDFIGDGTYDYNFTGALTSIKLIWAYSYGPRLEPADFFRHSFDTRGFTTASFATLGVADVSPMSKINVCPNPSTGVFSLVKDNTVNISSIKVYDTDAKVIKEINTDLNSDNINLDLSKLSQGTYFIEIANQEDKTVKKIIID